MHQTLQMFVQTVSKLSRLVSVRRGLFTMQSWGAQKEQELTFVRGQLR